MCNPFASLQLRAVRSAAADGSGCSGKCSGNYKRNDVRVWVLAACEGMVSLFTRQRDGQLTLIAQEGKTVAPSLAHFIHWMEDAAQENQFGQLVLVGSRSDVAWLQHSLGVMASKRVVAEISKALEPSWFKEAMPMPSLAGHIQAWLD